MITNNSCSLIFLSLFFRNFICFTVIGKGGEQISRIQSDTGCKVQIAPDAGGSNERSVTLTGTTEQIDRVKDVLRDIITRAEKTTTQFDPTQLPQGQTYTVIGVPGPKVGLIIGKSGETIKHLQVCHYYYFSMYMSTRLNFALLSKTALTIYFIGGGWCKDGHDSRYKYAFNYGKTPTDYW